MRLKLSDWGEEQNIANKTGNYNYILKLNLNKKERSKMNVKKLLLFNLLLSVVLTFEIGFAQGGFHSVTSTPAYTGGLSVLREFITHNISYAKDSTSGKILGIVTLGFIINTEGNVENIKIERGIDAKCDSEAVRVTQLAKGWKPAMRWGKPVPAKIIMPVRFYIDDSKIKQPFTVSGCVYDKTSSKPVESALVLIKGTDVGTLTDSKGFYSLQVQSEKSELEFLSMGYKPKSEMVGYNNLINVELLADDFIIDFSKDKLE